jgi:putative hydrolase of the HAD superfamily
MDNVTTLFWDIGGVILSNGWDHAARREAESHFHLDPQELELHHDAPFALYECGRITLETYLSEAVFYRPRAFTKEAFANFMLAYSREDAASRQVLNEVSAGGRYFVAALNNEGRELNAYRIRTFSLGRNFAAFFSSCYLGVRKPDLGIYRIALEVTQRAPEACVMIDDRPGNLDGARRAGMGTILFQNAAQLRADLRQHGVMA